MNKTYEFDFYELWRGYRNSEAKDNLFQVLLDEAKENLHSDTFTWDTWKDTLISLGYHFNIKTNGVQWTIVSIPVEELLILKLRYGNLKLPDFDK